MATVTQGGKDAFLTYPRTLGASREAKVRQAGRKEGERLATAGFGMQKSTANSGRGSG